MVSRRSVLVAGAVAVTAGRTGTRSRSERAESPLPSRDFVRRNVSVLDGEKVIDADSIRVAAGLVAEVGRDLPAAGDLPVHDAAGGTVLPGDQVRAVVAAAHDQGVLAVAHVSTTAAASGVDVLAHGPVDQRLTADQVDALRAAGTPVVATLSVPLGGLAGDLVGMYVRQIRAQDPRPAHQAVEGQAGSFRTVSPGRTTPARTTRVLMPRRFSA